MFRRMILMAAVVALGCAFGMVASAELILVDNGVSNAPIVVFKEAPPYTRRAADELALYIEKTAGAKPLVMVGEPRPMPQRAIWVGYQPILEELFPGLDFDFRHPEEILIAANENHLVIAGRDRWNPDHLVVPGRNWTIEGKQLEYGTANAVYTFLQDYLGVRWLWPGAMGEDILEQATIAFEPFEYRFQPPFVTRGDIFRLSRLGDDRGVSHRWSRRQGLQLDPIELPGGHGFVDWWDRFHETHPEYFALQPDGTRSAFPAPSRAKLCQSNPDVWDQWLADVEQALEEQPWRTVFDVSANDSAWSGICVCEACKAWDHPDGEPYTFYYADNHREPGVSLSDRYFTFANILARKLRERFPDRDLYVRDAAYYGSINAPLGVELEDNVIISFVGRFPLTSEEHRADEKRSLSTWKSKVPNLIYRPNQWVNAGAAAIPQIATRKLMEDIAYLMEHNCVGLWVDTIWEHWATRGPHYYLMGRLGWNPHLDGEELLDEYYRRGFGPASDAIREYWEKMESEFAELPYRERIDAVARTSFSEAFQAEIETLLDRAAEAVANEPETYGGRVEFVRAGYESTKLLFTAARLERRAQEEDNPALLEGLGDIWRSIRQIAEAHPIGVRYHWMERSIARNRMHVPPDMD